MEDKELKELVNILNQQKSNNLSEIKDDSILTNPNSMNEKLIFKCPECFDCPRMIFEIKNKKLSIKAYCYSHKKKIEKHYNLIEFIYKFGISKNEKIDKEYSLNKSQSLPNFDIENKNENQSNILVIDNDYDIDKDKTDYCQHQNVYKKIL